VHCTTKAIADSLPEARRFSAPKDPLFIQRQRVLSLRTATNCRHDSRRSGRDLRALGMASGLSRVRRITIVSRRSSRSGHGNVVMVAGSATRPVQEERSARSTRSGSSGPAETSSTNKSASFACLPAPTTAKISPAVGPTSGRTVVTITGSEFVQGSTVRFGTVPALKVTYISSTSLRAVTPAGSAGSVKVTVTTPSGTSRKMLSYTYDTTTRLPR
jgi:hypothetical protein